MSDPILVNPGGALNADLYPAPKTVTALAANSISKGELVALSTSPGYVIRNIVATSAGIQVGFALNDATSGKAVEIVTSGWALVKKGTSAMTAGNLVGADATTSGTVNAVTPATAVTQVKDVRGLVGVCVTDSTAGATTVQVLVGRF